MNEEESPSDESIITRLANVLEQRRGADPDGSYVASLMSSGTQAICGKIDEEAGEVIEAAIGDREHLVHETADLWFHSLVLLAYRGIHPERVLSELERRFGLSGLEEKKARTQTDITGG